MRSRLVIGLLVLAVAAPVVPAAAAPAAPVSSLEFGACPDDLPTRFPRMVCAKFEVPLDYRQPDGQEIVLFVTKVPARDPAKRRGVLLVNNGGPGAPASIYAGSISTPSTTGFTRLTPEVLDSYDILGLDPRGVGRSTPVSCVPPDYFAPPQPDPDTLYNRRTLWNLWNRYSDGCAAKSGPMLRQIGTLNVARDMDRLRALLGEEKLNYLGISYGTWLGAVYGHLFPARVGRMVLDGLINPLPRELWYDAALAQAPALQLRLEEWFRWLARYHSVFGLGDTVDQTRAAWNRTLASWRIRPHGVVGGNELLAAAYGTMFSELGWIPFAQALSDFVVRGNDSTLIDFATPSLDPGSEQFNAAFNSVICVDSLWPRDRARYEQDAAASARTAQLAWFNMWTSGAACQNWSVPAQERPQVTGRGMPRILMFNTIGDPATPYQGALKMHATLANSILVTERDSGSHGVFANREVMANPSARTIGTRYLITGELPERDTSIPGHPLPVPTPSTAVGIRASDLSPLN